MGKRYQTFFSSKKFKHSKSELEKSAMAKDASSSPTLSKKVKVSEKVFTKQKAENQSSLKRMKKRGLVQQMLRRFPKEASKSFKIDENLYSSPSETHTSLEVINILNG